MSEAERIAQVLRQALARGDLPAEARQAGEHLASRLGSPTRLVVLGLAGSGKTSLVNLLLGARLMPELPDVAVTELRFGPAPRIEAELADGTARPLRDLGQRPAGIVRLTQTLADPALRGWAVTEVNLTAAGPEAETLLDWAARRADLGIWCSAAFDDRERALWAKVPDHLKDHGVLALTFADRLHMKGDLARRIAALEPVVADEFLRMYPVATLQAGAARAGGAAQAGLWQSSGGKALVEGITRQVTLARAAELDHACLLLERFRIALPAEDAAPPQADRAPGHSPASQAHPPADPAPAPRSTANRAQVTRAATAQGPGAAGFQAAMDLLQVAAEDIFALPDFTTAQGADRVLDRCSAAAEDLVRLLSDGGPADPATEALREAAIEGEQMLMLLRLEREGNPAEDALTVLVQLKKDIAERALP